MEFLSALWLPIVVSAVFVWIASFLMWMVLPVHKGEWKGVSDEKGFMGALTEMGVQPGQYMFPWADDGRRMKDPEFLAALQRGPTGTLHVWPGQANMGTNLILSLLVYMLVSTFVAYVAYYAPIAAGTDYLHIFRITGAMATAVYVFGRMPNDIWFRTPSGSIIRSIVDGVVYGLVTAGAFGWLWPKA
jgi:hypothetical protein